MVLFTGKTVEEAIENGLRELNISRLKAHIKVISREKKGFLGFGRKPAQVDIESILERAESNHVTPIEIDEVEEELLENFKKHIEDSKLSLDEDSEKAHQGESEELLISDKDVQQPSKLSKMDENLNEDDKSVSEVDSSKLITDAVSAVTEYVQSIIYEMDIEASIDPTNNRRHINLQIETPDPGRVIGYHGKVLKSLQLLAQNFLHDHFSRHFSISLNVHDYMEQRTEVLIEFTHKIANRVLDTGQDYHMDSMSNSERKIVHKTIATIDGVTSFSEGNDPNRYVVVTVDEAIEK